MTEAEQTLIDRLIALVRAGKRLDPASMAFMSPVVARPVSPAQLARAESRLGFSLPPLLREMYLQVGNGGFGPAGGLFALDKESLGEAYPDYIDDEFDTIVWWYLASREAGDDDVHPWPPGYLMIATWGCNSYAIINAHDPQSPVFGYVGSRHDADEEPYEAVFDHEAPSLYAWFSDWINEHYPD